MLGRAAAALLVLATAAHAAPAQLTDPAVRAFVARQEAAWNARDVRAFEATFTRDARFVDQARGSDNKIVPYGESTLAQAMAQARQFFARSHVQEAATVTRIDISPDGARVFAYAVSRIETPGKPARTQCAETQQIVVLAGGRLLSRGQTATAVRCARPR